jgi:uncharacterized protein (DUF1330 family)
MTRVLTIGLSMIAGAAIGAAAIQGLHAQAKPPIYAISEIDINNLDAYTKEYAPKAQALIRANGGRILAAGQNVTTVEGAPTKTRVTVQVWDSMDKYQAYRNSAEFKDVRKMGDQYAKFRTITVEALSQ